MEISESLATSLNQEFISVAEAKIKFEFELHQLASLLKCEQAKIFMCEGVLRRLGIIHQCAKNIFTIFPPSRTDLLTSDELDTVTIHVQAFLVNVYGILDNIAWVCALENHFPEPEKNQLSIGLFKKEIKAFLPKRLLDYLNEGTVKTWFDDYARAYRDSTAHRIPPYIPPYRYTPEDSEKIQTLELEAHKALFEQLDIELHENLKEQQKNYYMITSLVVISTSSLHKKKPPFYMHPQMICDILTIHELLRRFTDGMNETLNDTKKQ